MAAINQQNNMATDIKSASLSEEDVTAIKAGFAVADTKMPFMQTLTEPERASLVKLGPERLSFVENGLQAAQNNPKVLSQSLDAANYASLLDVFQNLTDIETIAEQTATKIRDTKMVIGDILMQYASDVKKYVVTASATNPGLKPVADQLAVLFEKAAATRRANQKNKAVAK